MRGLLLLLIPTGYLCGKAEQKLRKKATPGAPASLLAWLLLLIIIRIQVLLLIIITITIIVTITIIMIMIIMIIIKTQ